MQTKEAKSSAAKMGNKIGMMREMYLMQYNMETITFIFRRTLSNAIILSYKIILTCA